jgi:hypothetical protein
MEPKPLKIHSKEVITEYRYNCFVFSEKLFFIVYQYRKTFSVIYAEKINRKTEYTPKIPDLKSLL